MRKPLIFGLHAEHPLWVKVVLALLPFLFVIGLYSYASHQRHQENPSDKLLPTADQMVDAVERVALTPDRRTGEYLLWQDTISSLKRLFIGLGLATLCALIIGLNIGVFPGASSSLAPFITTFSMIPPLAILPILFISFGVGEVGKIALIFIGTFPLMARDTFMAVKKVPKEQITKALTLGASELAVTYKVVLPQVMPKVISSLRLSLGAAWLFLIAAEAIAATDGLGYRIFLVRRYLSMDVIIPYVLWITCLGFFMDYGLRLLIRKRYTWYQAD